MRPGRVWVVAGLPMLLVGVVVVLAPRVDHFMLGLTVLVVALATAWLGDWMQSSRWRRPVGPRTPVTRNGNGRPDGSVPPPSLENDPGPEAP